MSQMDVENQDFSGVEFLIEQEGDQVWLRWPDQDDNVLLGRLEVVAQQFRNWLNALPEEINPTG